LDGINGTYRIILAQNSQSTQRNKVKDREKVKGWTALLDGTRLKVRLRCFLLLFSNSPVSEALILRGYYTGKSDKNQLKTTGTAKIGKVIKK
jgi:hypothetical protein